MARHWNAAQMEAWSALVGTRKKSKYGNAKTTVDGLKFDSKAEARRYADLKLQERSGTIRDLKCQTPFHISVLGIHICKYVADFTYFVDGRLVVEDVKGVRTREYLLKKKLMAAVHGIEISEYRRKK